MYRQGSQKDPEDDEEQEDAAGEERQESGLTNDRPRVTELGADRLIGAGTDVVENHRTSGSHRQCEHSEPDGISPAEVLTDQTGDRRHDRQTNREHGRVPADQLRSLQPLPMITDQDHGQVDETGATDALGKPTGQEKTERVERAPQRERRDRTPPNRAEAHAVGRSGQRGCRPRGP